jgi:hypothetical protein
MAKSNMKSYAAKRQKETVATAPLSGGVKKSVDIRQAQNGFIVSQYIPGTMDKPGRDIQFIFKTIEEAQAKAASLLKI